MYEHRCPENIKKLYTSSVKCNYQLQFKVIIEASMVTTPEIFTDNIPMSPGPPVIFKTYSAIKSLRLFIEVFYFKRKISFRRVGDSKSKRKSTRAGIMLWSSILEKKLHTKINEQFNKYPYNFILQRPKVV